MRNLKKNEGGPFETLNSFLKKMKMKIWNSLMVSKNVKGDFLNPLWDFLNIHSVATYQKIEGGLFGDNKKFANKSPTKPK